MEKKVIGAIILNTKNGVLAACNILPLLKTIMDLLLYVIMLRIVVPCVFFVYIMAK